MKITILSAPGILGTFSQPPRVSDPNMHLGTCVTHVPWCIPGSLSSGFLWSRWREKCFGHSWPMRNLQFYVSGKRPMELSNSDSTLTWPTPLYYWNSNDADSEIPISCGCECVHNTNQYLFISIMWRNNVIVALPRHFILVLLYLCQWYISILGIHVRQLTPSLIWPFNDNTFTKRRHGIVSSFVFNVSGSENKIRIFLNSRTINRF